MGHQNRQNSPRVMETSSPFTRHTSKGRAVFSEAVVITVILSSFDVS